MTFLHTGGEFARATQRCRLSQDSKGIIADLSFSVNDSAEKPRKFLEKSVYMLRNDGVDLTKIRYVEKIKIANTATWKTIDLFRLEMLGNCGRKQSFTSCSSSDAKRSKTLALGAMDTLAPFRGAIRVSDINIVRIMSSQVSEEEVGIEVWKVLVSLRAEKTRVTHF